MQWHIQVRYLCFCSMPSLLLCLTWGMNEAAPGYPGGVITGYHITNHYQCLSAYTRDHHLFTLSINLTIFNDNGTLPGGKGVCPV